MWAKVPPSGRSSSGADPERNPDSNGLSVSEEKIKQQQLPLAAEGQRVLQGELQSHPNQPNHQHPHIHSAAQEQLLQLQVKQLKKALSEQNALLNFLSPGLILPPAFLTQYQAYSLAQRPLTDPVSHAGDVVDCRKCVSNTVIIRSGVEQEVPACGPQITQCTDNMSLQRVETEQRRLTPIKEESCEPGEEACTVSPFGVRNKVPANPEERPIRPGLRAIEKTFEDFVEEQLELDMEGLKKDKQLRIAEKRNFLRKGDGRSRISKNKDTFHKIHPASKNTKSKPPQRPSTPSLVQHSHNAQINSLLHTQQNDGPALKNLSLMRKDNAKYSGQRFGQENLLRNNVPPHDGKSLVLNHSKHSSQNNEGHSKQPITVTNTSSTNCPMVSGSNVAQKIHLLEKRSGFKKVNDRIVRVCDLGQANTKTLSLTTEIKQLLLRSTSGENAGAMEDLKNPMPAFNLIKMNSDHQMDLSDEDYASDAPSDVGPSDCTQSLHCFLAQLSSSSESDDGSDYEIQQLGWSEPHKPSGTLKETSGEATPPCASSLDLLARIFPQVKCEGKNKMDNMIREKDLKTQHSVNGSQPVKPVKKVSNDLMMDKMKTEQDKALNFIRSEMERLTNNDKDNPQSFRSSDRTCQDAAVHLNGTEDLRDQIQFLKEQLKRRECEWWQAHSELQSRVDALTRENRVLMSRRVVQVRPQSSGRSTPHPDTQNLTRTDSVSDSQEKTKQKISSARRDSSNSRTSLGSQSPEDRDTIPYSECGEKCVQDLGRSVEKQIRVESRNSVAKGLQSTAKSGKSVSSESDYGSTDMTEDLLNSEMKHNVTQVVVREETRYPDGKVEQLLSDGSRVIVFCNGTRKEIGADQKSITVTFFNGDVKRILADGTMVYYYCDAQTTHSTYPSGLEVLQFPNKQQEKRHPDGTREILFPDGTAKTMYPDGRQESLFPDGTVVKLLKNGEKTVEFTNGQREIHTPQYKQRIYPDGTVKTVYLNGRQETKYSSGRIHIKNDEDMMMMNRK
ncbi:centromere protein J [Clarias gariepinus]|uniref:centromere protein J n=1 Tax=Clarias gariepinus TaxID=13013 RepID=UPI00234CF0C5|nr:centromere protein J [Clarias gariepinus]